MDPSIGLLRNYFPGEGGWKGVGRGLEGGWKGVGVMFMLDIFENIDIQPLSLIKDFVKNLRAAVFSF